MVSPDNPLYYNRARYYNPYTGRFLQTDPIGYGDGMNLYAYCRNNPVGFTDPTGTHTYTFEWCDDGGYDLTLLDDNGEKVGFHHAASDGDFLLVMARWDRFFDDEWKKDQDEGGLWANSGKNYRVFWDLRFLIHMGTFTGEEYRELGDAGVKIVNGPYKDSSGNIISYNYYIDNTVYFCGAVDLKYGKNYDKAPYYAVLAHELDHAYYDIQLKGTPGIERWEIHAVKRENKARYAYFQHSLYVGYGVYPRLSYTRNDPRPGFGRTQEEAWQQYWDKGQPVVY